MNPFKAPPQKVILSSSLLENSEKQKLQVVMKTYGGCKHIPAEVGEHGTAVLAFNGLLQCFKKAGFVAEGELKDFIWGFEQSGYDPHPVASGLTKLRDLGYLYYTDFLGNRIAEHNFDPKKAIWLRYSPKFLNLLGYAE